MRWRGRIGGGGVGSQQVWPVLLLLVAAVLVPTACVLWFMSHAHPQRAPGRPRRALNRVYRGHLAGSGSTAGGVGTDVSASWTGPTRPCRQKRLPESCPRGSATASSSVIGPVASATHPRRSL